MSRDFGSYAFAAEPGDERPVTLGIRPENLLIHGDGALQASVSLIEPMGNHHVVWLSFGANLLSCIVTTPLGFGVDDRVRFDIDRARISLFDKASEQRL